MKKYSSTPSHFWSDPKSQDLPEQTKLLANSDLKLDCIMGGLSLQSSPTSCASTIISAALNELAHAGFGFEQWFKALQGLTNPENCPDFKEKKSSYISANRSEFNHSKIYKQVKIIDLLGSPERVDAVGDRLAYATVEVLALFLPYQQNEIFSWSNKEMTAFISLRDLHHSSKNASKRSLL